MIYSIGKLLVISGIVLAAIGLIVIASSKIPWVGKLPGDILIKREGVTFYFPITTCILVSVILSFVLFIINKK